MKFISKKEIDIPHISEHRKLKRSIRILKYSTLFALTSLALYGVVSFNNTYSIQSPIIIRSPLVPRNRDVIVSPVGKKDKTGYIFNVGAIADKIYTLESSNGKNDGCNNLGLFNGYGYRQNSFEHICYGSHEEVRQLVINWLEKHIKEGNITQALCLYNQGLNENSCTYAVNYLSL